MLKLIHVKSNLISILINIKNNNAVEYAWQSMRATRNIDPESNSLTKKICIF